MGQSNPRRLREQTLEAQRLREQILAQIHGEREQMLHRQRLREQIQEQLLQEGILREQGLKEGTFLFRLEEGRLREQILEQQRLIFVQQYLRKRRHKEGRLWELRLEHGRLIVEQQRLQKQRLEGLVLREQILEQEQPTLREQRLEQAQGRLREQRLQQGRLIVEQQRLQKQRLEGLVLREQILEQEQPILREQRLKQGRLWEQILEQAQGRLRKQRLEQGRLMLEQQVFQEQILEQQRLIFEQQQILRERRLEQGILREQRLDQGRLIFERQMLREQRLEGLILEGLVLREQGLREGRLWEQILQEGRLIFEQVRLQEQRPEQGRLWEQRLILEQQILREQRIEGLILGGLVLWEQGLEEGRLWVRTLERGILREQILEQLGLEGLKLREQILEEGRLDCEQRGLWEQILEEGRLSIMQHRLRKQRLEQLRPEERSLGKRKRSLTRDFEAIKRLYWRKDMEKSSEAGMSGGESSAMREGLSLTRDFERGNSEAKIPGTTEMGKSLEAGTSDSESLAIDYEVFLSFRGPDTRQGFTDCLYNRMREANIRVFLDKEELHVGKEIGDELPMAIEKSKIYIPIFSKGYASSVWCLRELAHMVECTKSKPYEKEIMPIFYDVKPYDVKLKSQLYVGALEEHEEKFGCEKRQKWEDALKSVAQIKGWELKEQGHWNFMTSVIREILTKLKIKDKHVTQHLVGMDERVEAVVKLLGMDSGGMRFVIIHGMGGIGKTTLAKVVFNKQNSLFSHCCFLANVQESSRSSGFVALQKKLLSNIFGSGLYDGIDDDDDGIKVIAQRLSNRKVFIVIDDVNDKEQLDKLAINHIFFGSGSRIIMTTRNRSIVEADYTFEYKVNPLDPVQSLRLFSRHAFGRNAPPDDYVSLSRRVVDTTGGLPLALEVIGSLLCRQNKAFWMDVLDNLREIPHEKVQDKLKISFNALDHQQKQIFLDIACFFIDEDTRNAFYMWEECGFRPDYSTQVLVNMSLINITKDNKFGMHDQLRDLGRKIVHGDMRPINPRKQSRLWNPKTAVNIIRTKERKDAIEAICLDGNAPGIYTSEEFQRLQNIRFLKLRWGQLDGDFENQLSELRYMSWHRCPLKLFAINFHPRKLVVLDLSYSSITEDWTGWSQIKVTKKLKVLDLTNCNSMTRTPNFSDYLSLKRLVLKNCKRLIEVDGSLEKLEHLIYFNADGCTSLTELPEAIRGFKNLEYLYLGNCKWLRKLPESFMRVASLVELDLSYTAITRLPDSIGNQKHLSVLKLRYTKISELPISIGNLESLLELDISGTYCLWLPESIGDLSRLKVINISNSLIRELPRSIIALKELEELHGKDCQFLKWEIPEDIGKLSLLRVLNLQMARIKSVKGNIKLPPCLEKLDLWHCSELVVLPELPTSLINLCFGSSSLQQVPDLTNLTKLVDLSYGGNDKIWHPLFIEDGPFRQSLMFLPPSLSTLSLEYHKSICSLSFHCNLRNLTCLRIYQCKWIEVQLDGLGQLIEFQVEGLEFLLGFAGLSRLKRLKLWTLIDCPNLTAIQGLGSVESLEQFEIKECPGIQCLDDLADLKKLESLVIRGCDGLLVVKGLDELETIKRLDFNHCESLESFSNIVNSKIPDECCINIFGCPNLSVSGPDISYKAYVQSVRDCQAIINSEFFL